MRRGVQSAIDARRSHLQRGEQVLIAPTRVVGVVNVTNSGEVLVSVEFPVWFTERPSFSFGGELTGGFSPQQGTYPTISVLVASWNNVTRGLGTYWAGAALAIVTTGEENQQMIVHWQMEGHAMQNPVSPGLQVDQAI